MPETFELRETLRRRGRCDIVVAGGGVAGAAAALAARRRGKHVVLIEKACRLGGLATLGLVNLWVPLCNGRGRQIITGLAEELLRLSIRRGYDTLPPEWRDGPPSAPTDKRYATRFSAPIFSLELLDLLAREGVELLLDCVAARPVMSGRRCAGLALENKSGGEYLEAGMVVDCTGDADLLARAGVPVAQGKNYFTYYGFRTDLDLCRKAVESGSIGGLHGHAISGPANLYGRNHPEGMRHFTGTTVDDVTDYLVTGQRALLEKIAGEPRQARDLVALPDMPQFRTTRRIEGDYTLRAGDAYRHFPDSIGAVCDFDRRDFLYEVPYRTLTRGGFDNLLTAGRSASAEGYAWDVLRVIPPAVLTGQAAGAAAALALDSGRPAPEVEISALQEELARQGVTIHFDDAWIPADGAASGEAGGVGDHL